MGPQERPHTPPKTWAILPCPQAHRGLGHSKRATFLRGPDRARGQGSCQGLPRSPETHNPDWDSSPPSLLKDTLLLTCSWLCWIFCRQVFSPAAAAGARSWLGAQPPRRGGSSCHQAEALGHAGFGSCSGQRGSGL